MFYYYTFMCIVLDLAVYLYIYQPRLLFPQYLKQPEHTTPKNPINPYKRTRPTDNCFSLLDQITKSRILVTTLRDIHMGIVRHLAPNTVSPLILAVQCQVQTKGEYSDTAG